MAVVTQTNSEVEEIAQTFVEALSEHLEPLNAFAIQTEMTGKEENDVSKVTVYNNMGDAVTFNESSQNYEDEQGEAVTFVDVTLNTHRKHTFSLQDKKRKRVDIDKLVSLQAQAVARTVIKDIYATILVANFTNSLVVGAATAMDSDKFSDFWSEAETLLWAEEPRYSVQKSTYMANLLKDNDLKNADASGDTGLLRKAKFSEVNGFQPISSQLMPTNGENLVGIITNGSPIAVGFAPVPVDDGGADNGVSSFMVSAPGGLTISMRSHYDPATGKRFWTAEFWFGQSVVQDDGLVRLTSA